MQLPGVFHDAVFIVLSISMPLHSRLNPSLIQARIIYMPPSVGQTLPNTAYTAIMPVHTIILHTRAARPVFLWADVYAMSAFSTDYQRLKFIFMAYLFLSLMFLGSFAILVRLIKNRTGRKNNKVMIDIDTFLYLKKRDDELWKLEKAERSNIRYVSPRLKQAGTNTCLN